MTPRSRLAVAITAKDAALALPGAIEHARTYADEVIVGVDEASTDLTLEVAMRAADVVYRYETVPGLRAPRTLAVTRTHADWLLLLTPDERAGAPLVERLPVLLGGDATHYAIPCRTIKALARMPEPDGTAEELTQVRLVRADASVVWEPPVEDAPLRVIGRRGSVTGAGIGPALRPRSGDPISGAITAPATTPLGEDDHAPGTATLVPGVVDVRRLPHFPAWHATITIRHLTHDAEPGASVLAQVEVRNSGALQWPASASIAEGAWPQLALVCRATDDAGMPLDSTAQRYPVPQAVRPGESIGFVCRVALPRARGMHLLRWDMESVGEIWFEDCGAEPATAWVRTRHGARPA